MRLEVNGTQYTNFTSATCEIRLDALTNTFSFEAVSPNGQALPFKGGEACTVIVDGEKVLTGFIEVVAVNYDGSDHTIRVSGRDKTADLLDSTIDDLGDLRGEELTLKALIEAVINQLGMDIEVIDQANPKPYSVTEDIAAAEPGENAFSFIEKYARKRQVLLTSDADGNVVITKNSGITADGAVQHIIGAEDNNVMSSSFSFDTTGRYNIYKMASGLNPVALNQAGDSDLASLVNQSGGVTDDDIRETRRLILISETPYGGANCEVRAKWEADIRRARGLVYSAQVPGYRVDPTDPESALWRDNRIYQIVDDFVGKIEPMLCNSVTFTFDESAGRDTSLGFVGKDAYTLFIEPDPFAEVADNVA
jgi:prophage tail gpP-like protein